MEMIYGIIDFLHFSNKIAVKFYEMFVVTQYTTSKSLGEVP